MRAAATIEDGTEKSAVTPGPLAPARELVGEMLLQMNQPADALKEFEATLEKEPNRFRALYRRRQVGLARRRSPEGAHVLRRPAEDLRALGPARSAGAGRSSALTGGSADVAGVSREPSEKRVGGDTLLQRQTVPCVVITHSTVI